MVIFVLSITRLFGHGLSLLLEETAARFSFLRQVADEVPGAFRLGVTVGLNLLDAHRDHAERVE